MIAARLSTVRCRELLAATCVELLKAALVGSADPAPAAGVAEAGSDASGASGASGGSQTPEELLDSLHATLSATLQDAAHRIAPEHHEAWAEGQWEAFQEAHNAVQRMLLGMHTQAAQGGCAGGALQVRGADGCRLWLHVHPPDRQLAAAGRNARHASAANLQRPPAVALCWAGLCPSLLYSSAAACFICHPCPLAQVARCLEFGLLVPQDSEAAFREYKSAAALGSSEGSLRCGIHYFEGTAPGGQSCANECICSWLLGGSDPGCHCCCCLLLHSSCSCLPQPC